MYAVHPATRRIEISITDGRAKTANLRRDPRATLHVSSLDGWAYAVAEAEAELSVVAAAPEDETVERLVGIYRTLAGEQPVWDQFRRAMVADQRLLIRITVERVGPDRQG